ncbi:MAG: hypothetical protein ABI557_05580 [Aureliella sp.]
MRSILEPLRICTIEVVDHENTAVEGARVGVKFGLPQVLTCLATDKSGKVSFSIPASEHIESVVAWKDNLGLDYRLYTLPRSQSADVKTVPPEFPHERPERLILEGARPLTVHVADAAGEPIEGASLYPIYFMKPQATDGLNFSFFLVASLQRTDAQGETTFAWLPSWQEQVIQFGLEAEGFDPIQIIYDPSSNGKLAVSLNRLVPIRGQVIGADGQPAADIQIRAMGRGRSRNDFRQTAQSDAEGRYEIAVAPNERTSVRPSQQYYVKTDELGQYEFSLGDGEFDLRPPQKEQVKPFTITGQPDIELDLTTKIQSEVELVGIVIDRETSQPIVNAAVSGALPRLVGGDWQATTGKDGKFKVRRREEATYIQAVSADASRAAIVEVGDAKKAIVIQLDRVGVAHGRLLNGAREPVVGKKLGYGVKVGSNGGAWTFRFGGAAVTDELGNFEFPTLAAGWEYTVFVFPPSSGVIQQMTLVTVEASELKELGDLPLPIPPKP